MVTVALLTLSLAGAPSAAVVDLSPRAGASALAEALRALPALRGRVFGAAQTHAVVTDAAGLGLSCRFDDDACLQKLMVLARVDELIALQADAAEVRLARATTTGVQRSSSRVAGSPAARARAAWGALQRVASADGTHDRASDDSADDLDDVDDLDDDGADRERDVRSIEERAETPTATSGGVTAPLVVGLAGACTAVVLGAAAIGVSAALAQQLRGTQLGVPLDDSFDTLQVTFWSVSAAATAAAVTGAIGLGWFVAEGGAAVSEP